MNPTYVECTHRVRGIMDDGIMTNRRTLLFITPGNQEYVGGKTYNYGDDIYKNVITKEHLVLWSGQKKGRQDFLVTHRDNIHIWFRGKSNSRFSYLGNVKTKLILNPRDNDNLLQMQFKLDTVNCPIPVGTLGGDLGKGTCCRRYKSDCFTILGLTPVNNYYASGIKEGRVAWFP